MPSRLRPGFRRSESTHTPTQSIRANVSEFQGKKMAIAYASREAVRALKTPAASESDRALLIC